jgi:hypothetical protein
MAPFRASTRAVLISWLVLRSGGTAISIKTRTVSRHKTHVVTFPHMYVYTLTCSTFYGLLTKGIYGFWNKVTTDKILFFLLELMNQSDYWFPYLCDIVCVCVLVRTMVICRMCCSELICDTVDLQVPSVHVCVHCLWGWACVFWGYTE